MIVLNALHLPWQQRATSIPASISEEERPRSTARVWVLGTACDRRLDLQLSMPRVSDSLNAAVGGWVRDVDTPDAEARWLFVTPADMLVVVPPDHSTDRLQRLHRTARRVRIVVPPYEVIGNAHVQPGSDPVAFLLRHARTFVPVTSASLRRAGQDLGVVPTALVNLRAAVALTVPDAIDGRPLATTATA